MKVRLETRDGQFVCNITIMPFQLSPDALTWGTRFFVKHAELEDRVVYREAFCFSTFNPPMSLDEEVWPNEI